MEKREDYWWRESTLGEDVDGKVGTYLRANHQEYQEIRCNRAKKLRKKCAKIVVHTKERKSPNLIVKILNSKLKK